MNRRTFTRKENIMRIRKYSLRINDSGMPFLYTEMSTNYPEIDKISGPRSIVKMLDDVFGFCQFAEEHLYMLAMIGSRLTGVFEVTHGSPVSSMSSPRNIFARLLQCNASTFVLVHNHPSGNVAPSGTDLDTARKLSELSIMMECRMLDFIVAGREYGELKWWSMFENGEIDL